MRSTLPRPASWPTAHRVATWAVPGAIAIGLTVAAGTSGASGASAVSVSPAPTPSASTSVTALREGRGDQAASRGGTLSGRADAQAMERAARRAASERRAEANRRAEAEKEKRAEAKEKAAAEERKRAKARAKKEAEAKAARARRWTMPVEAPVSSTFGMRWGRMHAGIDLAAEFGAQLHAMHAGVVVFAGAEGGYGNKVEIRYPDGTVSFYGHMSSISVSTGQEVAAGDVVGRVGNTGRSTGPHLHLEIHPGGGGPVDPMGFLASKGLHP